MQDGGYITSAIVQTAQNKLRQMARICINPDLFLHKKSCDTTTAMARAWRGAAEAEAASTYLLAKAIFKPPRRSTSSGNVAESAAEEVDITLPPPLVYCANLLKF